jgi:uncharacterized protein YndB with AHSA1/START domain
MTVDLRHPIDRVWRALTDRRLLPQWFATADRAPGRVGARFQLRPVDLPGFDPIDSELIELDEPHRLVMRWQEAELRSLVVCELTPTPDGCRLTLTQTRGGDEWEAADRDRRQEATAQILDGRLPAVLDWLAFRDVDLGETAVIPRIAPAPGGPARPRFALALALVRRGFPRVLDVRRLGLRGLDVRGLGVRRSWLVGGLAGVVLLALVVTVGGLTRVGAGEPADAAAAGPTSSTTSAAAPATTPVPTMPAPANRTDPIVSATRVAPRPSKSPTKTTPPPAPLDARYATTARLFGYSAEVAINNPGTTAGRDWILLITLPENARMYRASGASYQVDGQKITFTGQPVPAGGSLRIRFDVSGARQGSDCAINGRACGGL